MENMISLIISIVAFLVAISILVTFHEFGHFWVARRLGVKVLRFSVGFGKPLWRFFDKQNTEYVISALPLGGYVKMLDEREGPVSDDQKPFAFNNKPVWARFLIVLAGPVFNFIFAILAYWAVFMIGIVGVIPDIGDIVPNSIAARAGLKAGEEIVAVDHSPTPTWQQVMKQLMRRLGDKDQLEIATKEKQTGVNHSYLLDLHQWELKGGKPDLLHALGIEPYQPPIYPVIHEVIFDEPAGKAGILRGDIIKAVNGKPITTWKEFTDVVAKSIQQPVQVTVERNHVTTMLEFVPRAKESDTGEMIGFAGVVVKTTKAPESMLRKERYGPVVALKIALEKTWEYIIITFKIIGKMIVGDIGLGNLSGPISIAQGAGATAIIGLAHYLGFLAIISVSLGVLNLLPIPILDGGHLFYFLIEFITGKPVSQRFQEIGFRTGMLILIGLMSIAFYNDVIRLEPKRWLSQLFGL
jgi:regulator of sigma E protease